MQHTRYDISVEDLRQLLSYDPESGVLTWLPRPLRFCKNKNEQKRWNSRCAGKIIKPQNSKSYIRFKIFDVVYRAHRVCWALHHGEWPPEHLHIDHINEIKNDNRMDNLQLVTLGENVSLRFSRQKQKAPCRRLGNRQGV